ncbi:rhodanese-like domain-containing protein [Pyruvatibacter sp.]|uniref:rhodanese-like domain-containing protein n=1 Tax=Pyruvatibacter sp. TaxID=1981328 RepID=UPI003263DD72
MTLHPITPEDAKLRVATGTRLIDVRERDEHLRERIAGSRCIPASKVPTELEGDAGDVIFHCRSGNRTQALAGILSASAPGTAYVLEGGLDAWKKAGLAVEKTPKAPLEIMRQVQMIAGGLVLLGVVLGYLVAPGFFGLSAFVGAGLFFAGASGWCGMARLLAVMPWNRVPEMSASDAAGVKA